MSIVQLSRFFVCVVLFKRQLLYFIKSLCLCQELFYFSLSLFSSFPLPSHATAYLEYHFQNSLSTTFLIYSQNLSRFFTVQLSRFFVLSLSATTSILYQMFDRLSTTSILYQMFDRLSTTFLIYFFAFIAIRIDFCRASRVSLVIISCSPTIVNNKFHFFAFSFFNKAIDLF